MLKIRIITAIVLVVVVIAALYYLPSPYFAVFLGSIIVLAAWEWAGLCNLKTVTSKVIYASSMIAIGAGVYIGLFRSPDTLSITLIITVIWWLVPLMGIIRTNETRESLIFTNRWLKLMSGYLILLPPWMAVVYLQGKDSSSRFMLLALFIIVWLADSAAYLTGRKWGKTKLAPRVSPGKSIEGLIGGIVAVTLFALGFALSSGYGLYTLIVWLIMAVLTGLYSVLGDLTESKFKRVAGVKDSGKLLPGHGGVLDRIDALTAAAPVYTLCWLLFLRVAV